MADTNNGLPEGTDMIIEGGGSSGSSGGTGRSGTTGGNGSPSTAGNSTGARTAMTASDSGTDSLITGSTTDQGSSTGSDDDNSGSGSGSSGGIRGMISTAGTKARDEAASRARGLVGQGLTSSSATLGNVASIIEDTVEQIGQRLGPQYADYARTASQTVNRYASTLQNKDPDELVDDARELVRKSPGVALAGAAIVGFGLIRLLKAGMEAGTGATGSTSGRKTDQSA